MPSFDIAGRGKMWFIMSLLVIALTQLMLKLLVNAKIVESPSAYGANGFVLFDPAADGKAVK